MAFDLDEGGWQQAPSFPTSFTWRAEPETSFSDWTIVVVDEDGWDEEEVSAETRAATVDTDGGIGGHEMDKERDAAAEGIVSTGKHASDTCHVHKCTLSHGERASGYFFTLFTTSSLGAKEAAEAKSVLRMPAACRACFPLLLDFVYEGKLSPTLDPAALLPLMELARRLQIPALGQELASRVNKLLGDALTNKGCLPDLKMEEVLLILRGAIELRMEKVQAAVLKVVGTHFRFFHQHEQVRTLPLELLLRLLSDDELGVLSEDEVFDCVASRVRAMELDQPLSDETLRMLWGCVRFASLSTVKQVALLQEATAPRDLFLSSAVACLVHQQLVCGREPCGSLLAKCANDETCVKPRGFARGNTRAFTMRCSGAPERRVNGATVEAHNIAGVLMDEDPTTGVVAWSSHDHYAYTHNHRPDAWIELEFKADCLITDIRIRAYRGRLWSSNGRATADAVWQPIAGAGAAVAYKRDHEAPYTPVGDIPPDFGTLNELYEVPCPTGPFVARVIRFHRQQGSIGLSQVVFNSTGFAS